MTESEIRASRDRVFGETGLVRVGEPVPSDDTVVEGEWREVDDEAKKKRGVFYPRIIRDFGRATRQFQRIRGLEGDALIDARSKNDEIKVAIDDLEAAGIKTSKFVGGDEEQKLRRKLSVAIKRVEDRQKGKKVDPEDLNEAIDWLGSVGVDTSKIEFPPEPIAVNQEEKQDSDQQTGENLFAANLRKRLKMAGLNPNARRRAVENWMQRNADHADKIPDEVIAEAHRLMEETDLLIQEQRVSRRSGGSAFGKTPEELARMGVETVTTRDDLLMRELRRPILGDEMPQDPNNFTFVIERRRAISEDEAFSEARIAELLAETYSAYLQGYNGEVTNKSELNVQALTTVDGELRRRATDLEALVKRAVQGIQGQLVFKSLIPFPDGSDPLDVADIATKIATVGYDGLSGDEKNRIPEIKALEAIKNLISWNDAQTELIRTLQTIRSYGVAKEIDTMAALGKNPDRLVMKTSSMVKLWSLEGLTGNERKPDGDWVADVTDMTTRIYGLIAETAVEVPGQETGNNTEKTIKSLVRSYLTDRDQIVAGAKPKDVVFVLNRFAQNLTPERLAKVEAFVACLVKNKVLSGGIINLNILSRELKEEIDKSRQTVLQGVANASKTVEIKTREEREFSLGIDNAVAMIHVTGLSDTWSGYYEWSDEKPDDLAMLPRYSDGPITKVGKIKVGGYPACTAGADVANYKKKLMAGMLERKLVASKVLIDQLDRLPDNLAYNYLQAVTINDGGNVTSLWREWHDLKVPLREVAKRMAGKVAENAIQKYFGSIAGAKSLADLLKGTDAALLKELTDSVKGQGKIQVAIDEGLGMPFSPERDAMVAELKAIIYAGPLLYSLGLTEQLTSADVVNSLEDTNMGASAESALEDCLIVLIKDYISSSNDISGVTPGQAASLHVLYPNSVVGAMDSIAMKKFATIVEGYYKKYRRGVAITDRKGLSPALLADVTRNKNPKENIPYATIWKDLLIP